MSNPDASPDQASFSSEGFLSHDITVWPPEPFNRLTSRQLDMIDLASKGFTREETADALSVNLRVINNDRMIAIGKLGLRSANHLVRLGCDVSLFWGKIETPASMHRPKDIPLEAFNIFSYGHTANHVALALDVKETTANSRKVQAVRALGAKSFAHAIRLAWQEGFLPAST